MNEAPQLQHNPGPHQGGHVLIRPWPAPAPLHPGGATRGVLELQRSFGNAAVVGLLDGRVTTRTSAPDALVLQRRLSVDKAIRNRGRTGVDVNLGQAVAAYNQRVSKLSPSARLDAIDGIARYIYAWYTAQDTRDIASLQGPEALAIRKLEKALEADHQKAVDALMEAGKKRLGTATPPKFGDDRTKGDGEDKREDTFLLLHEIASGNGPIKLVGDAKFQAKARSMLVRIMDSAMGKQVLEGIARISRSHRKTVTIGTGTPPPELAGHLGEAAPTESKAVPQVTDVGGKEAGNDKGTLAESLSNMKKLDAAPDDVENFGVVAEPADFQSAVLSGKRGIAVTKDAKTAYYEFGSGARGVYVALVAKELGETSDNINTRGGSVHTPEFVTLAHELGHALNMLVGAGTVSCRDLFSLVAGDVGTFENPTAKALNWSNAEEYSTIQVVENTLRSQLGIDLRGGHQAVLDPEVERKVQEDKETTRLVGSLVTAVWTKTKGSKRANIPATVPESIVGKLDRLSTSVLDVSNLPLKGLSNSQKAQRSAVYQASWRSTFKELAKYGKVVKAQVTSVLDGGGEHAGFRNRLEQFDPKILRDF